MVGSEVSPAENEATVYIHPSSHSGSVTVTCTIDQTCSHSTVSQDIPENGADVAHLDCLHGAGVSSGSGTNYKELISGKLHTHTWTARWEGLPHPSTHIGRMTLTMTNIILGLKVKALDITSVADQVCVCLYRGQSSQQVRVHGLTAYFYYI